MDFPGGQGPADFMRSNDPNRKNNGSNNIPAHAGAGTGAASSSSSPAAGMSYPSNSSAAGVRENTATSGTNYSSSSSSRERSNSRRPRDMTGTTASSSSPPTSTAREAAHLPPTSSTRQASGHYHNRMRHDPNDHGIVDLDEPGFAETPHGPQHLNNNINMMQENIQHGDAYDLDDNPYNNQQHDGSRNFDTRTGNDPTTGRMMSSGGGTNFLSRDMQMLSLNMQQEPNEPMDNPMISNDMYYSRNDEYPQNHHYQQQQNMDNNYHDQQHQQHHYPHQSRSQPQRSVRIPEPRAGKPPRVNADTLRQRVQEPTVGQRHLGRRCLTEKISRKPDRVQGVLAGVAGGGKVEGEETSRKQKKGASQITGWTTTDDDGSAPQNIITITIHCPDCKTLMDIPTYSVIIECPNCQTVRPVASCQVGKG